MAVSRMREGGRILARRSEAEGGEGHTRAVDWREALYLATLGGMRALGLAENTRGSFEVGASFDAQHSESDLRRPWIVNDLLGTQFAYSTR